MANRRASLGRCFALSTASVATALSLVAACAVAGPASALAPAKKAKPKVAHFCWGAENAPPQSFKRNRPKGIVLECEAYSPQHGFTNANWISDITWDSFGGKTASGSGTLQHLWCPDGGDLVGTTICKVAQASIPALVTLSGSAKDGRSGYTRYTTVTVLVDALPEEADKGPQTLVWRPEPTAYS